MKSQFNPPYGHTSFEQRNIPVQGTVPPFYIERASPKGLFMPLRGGVKSRVLFFGTIEGAARRARTLLGEETVKKLVSLGHLRIVSAMIEPNGDSMH